MSLTKVTRNCQITIQSWFWKKEWQEEEKKVNKARKNGQVKSVKNVKEMERLFEK